jgi:FtsZ-binding cell division protein ZapB
MIKIYALIFVIGIIGVVGYGAKYYYDTTQATIATLRDNNAKLEVAVETANESLKTVQADIAKMADLNNKLQKDLQKAEAYGDELRGKLSRMNLVVEALKDAKVLEGKMNGATAKLWRGFMGDTGNTSGSESPLPEWLQSVPTGTGDKSGNQNREDNSTSSSKTEASPAG